MKRKWLAVGIILLFVTIAYAPAMAQNTEKPQTTVKGNTIYVDDSNLLGPWDGTLEHPYQRIWQGVNQAHENDTVFVFIGSYHEVNITEIKKKIMLIVELKELTYCNYITLLSSGINISGFTIDVLTIYSNDNIIENNIFRDSKYCINFYGDASNNIVKNNIIFQSSNGISFSPETYNNTIEQNLIENSDIGIYLRGINQKIQYNIIRDNNYAIISESEKTSIFFNVIHSNTIGIYQRSGSQSEIRNNLISRNTQGIDISYGTRNNILGNTFRLNDYGLSLGTALNFTLIKDNNFYVNKRPINYKVVCENLLSFFYSYFKSPNIIVRNFPRPIIIFIFIDTPSYYYDVHICMIGNIIPRILPYTGFNYIVFLEKWSKNTVPSDFTQMVIYND